MVRIRTSCFAEIEGPPGPQLVGWAANFATGSGRAQVDPTLGYRVELPRVPVRGKTRAMGLPVLRTSHHITSSLSSSRSSQSLLQLRYLGPGFLSLLHLSLPHDKPTAPGPLSIMSGGGNIKVVVRYVITTIFATLVRSNFSAD